MGFLRHLCAILWVGRTGKESNIGVKDKVVTSGDRDIPELQRDVKGKLGLCKPSGEATEQLMEFMKSDAHWGTFLTLACMLMGYV